MEALATEQDRKQSKLDEIASHVEKRLPAERQVLSRMPRETRGRSYTKGVIRTLEEIQEFLA